MKYILVFLLLFSCGAKKPKDITNPIDDKVAVVRQWLPTCNGYVSKAACDDGDVMLWSGLLCLSGETIGCATARASFDQDGRAWRSPRRVGADTYPTFSRDQFLGALAYFVGSKDTETAQKYMAWVRKHNNRVCMDLCDMTPVTWGIAASVWHYLGLPLTSEMKSGQRLDELGSVVSAIFNEGYKLHLIMVADLLKQKTGTENFAWKIIAATVYEKQPYNPFATYLRFGRSDITKQRLINRIPTSQPAVMNQWSFERDESEQAWRSSMCWEFVFMGNLMR